MRYFLSFSLLLLLGLNLTSVSQAQGSDAESRAAQWESYALPSGQFVRYVDKTKGWSLWRPAEWSETRQNDGRVDFAAPDQTASVSVATENLPEGYGIASYTTAFLQQLRNQRINPETVKVRRVFPGGVEGREIVLDLERSPGDLIRETIWMTQVGPRVYLFFLFAPPDKHEQYEPLFKRLMLSARIGVAGQWDEQFETLRARLTSEKNLPGLEIEAARIAQAIRTAPPGSVSLNQKLAELVTKSPAVIFDLLTDPDPQARAAAIRALSRLGDPVMADVLLRARGDKDAYCSSVAVRSIATLVNRDDPNFPLTALKNSLPALAENPETILNLGAALSDDKARDGRRTAQQQRD
jgi:hypothetical protein